MAEVSVVMTPQEAKLWKAQQKINAQVAQMEQGYKKVGKAGQAAGRNTARGAKSAAISQVRLQRAITSTAAQYLSWNAGLSLVNRSLSENKALRDEALTSQASVAIAQQESLKNLTGLTSSEKSDILSRVVPEIQARIGFPSQAALTDAIGAGFSASGDITATTSAVDAAAQITRLTPEAVQTVSAGALDVARGSGITDAEKNIGFLLSAGAINRIEDPAKLARNLAPVVGSGVASVPDQDPQEAAREIAAVFGILARAATDVRGESTSTAETTLLQKLDKFFTDPPERKPGAPERPADPGTLFGRIEVIGKDEALRKELLGTEGFGEMRFKKAIEQLLTEGTSLSKELRPAKEQVQFDAGIFRQVVREATTATAQLRNATAAARSQANIEQLEQSEGIGSDANALKILQDTLRKTRPETSAGFFAPVTESVQITAAEMGLFGKDLEAAAISILERRIGKLQQREFNPETNTFEITADPQQQAKAEAVFRAIGQLEQLRAGKAESNNSTTINNRTTQQVTNATQAKPEPRVPEADMVGDFFSANPTIDNPAPESDKREALGLPPIEVQPGNFAIPPAPPVKIQQTIPAPNVTTQPVRVPAPNVTTPPVQVTAPNVTTPPVNVTAPRSVEQKTTEVKSTIENNTDRLERMHTERTQIENKQVATDRTEKETIRELTRERTEPAQQTVDRQQQPNTQGPITVKLDTRGFEAAIEEFKRAAAGAGNTGLQQHAPAQRLPRRQSQSNAQRAQAAKPA